MSGRAKAAPLLNKLDGYDGVAADTEVHVLSEIDERGTVVVPEAELHDITVWPHLHSEELMARMFPTAVAAPSVDDVSVEEAGELGRLHRRWAAVRIGITRG